MEGINTQIRRLLAGFSRRSVAWLRGVKASFQVRVEAMRLSLRGGPEGCLPRYLLTLRQMHPEQAGFSTAWLEALIVGIILLVVVIQFLWQQGIPAVISATGNTTALTEAGATSAQVSWVTFIGGAIVIFLLIGALIIGIRVSTSGMGSGGGGGRRRRGRRRR